MRFIYSAVLCLACLGQAFAQETPHSAGTWYVEYTDISQLFESISGTFVQTPTIGIAPINNLVVQASAAGYTDDLLINAGARFFMGDMFIGARLTDIADNWNGTDLHLEIGSFVGISEKWYFTPKVGFSAGLSDYSALNVGAGIGMRIP